jgi:hypothetical protein
MIRKIKTIGLALVAAFVATAVLASAAWGTAGTLTTFPAGKTVVATGEQVGELAFTLTDHPLGGGFANIKCKKVTGDGVGAATDGATTVTMTPTFGECTAFGLSATTEHNECTFVGHTGDTTGLGGWNYVPTASCPPGKAMTLRAGTCEIAVGSQELGKAELTNSGSASPETAMDILAHFNIRDIKYTVVKDGIGCPLSGTGSFSKGDCDGTLTIKAHDSSTGNVVGVTLHN